MLPDVLESFSEIISYWGDCAENTADNIALLAPHLPEDLLSDALNSAWEIIDEDSLGYKVDYMLSSLASHLPENLLSDALETALSIKDEELQKNILSSIAPHLPKNLLPDALEVMTRIGDQYAQAKALSFLAPQLLELWSKALTMLDNITGEFSSQYQAELIIELAPHLPENLIPQALEIALNIGSRDYFHIPSEKHQANALNSLIPYLPTNLAQQASEAKKNLNYKSNRPVETITFKHYSERELSTPIPNVDKISNPYDFWCELIHSLASLKRKELLREISENSQIIKELGSSETFREIADAIADVGRWFP